MGVLYGPADARDAALDALRPIIERSVDAMEAEARLPDDLVDALRQAGAFRMPMPAAWGGPELPFVEICEVIEQLSYLEGAVGWVVMIGCDGGFYSAWLDDAVGRELYTDLDAITAGWVLPAGRATPADGGYRLSGRWSFGSGSTSADWFCSGGLVADTLEWRLFFVPAAEVQVLAGTWDTTGLRGSGSNDYSCDDVFVPTERTFSLLDPPRRPGALYAHRGTFAVKVAAVALGLGRRAIDEFAELAPRKLVMPALTPMSELPAAQVATARAEALVTAHRTWFFDVLARLAAALERGDELPEELRRHLVLAASAAVQASREAVEELAAVAGTDSIRRGGRLERIRRDLATAATHVVGKLFEPAGRSRLGLDPAHPLF
jgi:alkylation response protein AidB-like acyl-CoA dehydrogenase